MGRAAGCGAVRGDLGFLLQPDLDPARAVEIRDHLAACDRCRLLYTRVKANYEALRRKPPLDPGESFAHGVLERLPRRVPRRLRRARFWVLPLAALAGALARGGLRVSPEEPGLIARTLDHAGDIASRLGVLLLDLASSLLT
jgi:predicted anti-sigma-YlaC factor YlaD